MKNIFPMGVFKFSCLFFAILLNFILFRMRVSVDPNFLIYICLE